MNGRDLTVNDVRDAYLAVEPFDDQGVVDYLNRIARPAEASQRPDPSPRSWSLPAPPPDDVTVVHLRGDGMRCERKGDYWVNPYGGELTWGELFSDGFTVVEGEPPAHEPQEPWFKRGFYRLARDLDVDGTPVPAESRVVVVHTYGERGVYVASPHGAHGLIPVTALAAAGAVSVDTEGATRASATFGRSVRVEEES